MASAHERPDLLGSVLALACVLVSLVLLPTNARHRSKAMLRNVETPSELVMHAQASAEPHF